MSYKGTIIQESLQNIDVLADLRVLGTRVEVVGESHRTPWLSQWTLHEVEISDDSADAMAVRIQTALERAHAWYADFRNASFHVIIFADRVFKIDRSDRTQYEPAVQHGLALGIPPHQLDWSGV